MRPNNPIFHRVVRSHLTLGKFNTELSEFSYGSESTLSNNNYMYKVFYQHLSFHIREPPEPLLKNNGKNNKIYQTHVKEAILHVYKLVTTYRRFFQLQILKLNLWKSP